MKKKYRLIIKSIVALVAVSPIMCSNGNINVNVHAVNIKNSSAGTIRLKHNAYVYDKNGKRLDKYMGSKNTKISKGVQLKYSDQPVMINGTSYYGIGSGAYVKVANVGYVDGKPFNYKIVSVKLKHNSYIYDSNGNTNKQSLKKNNEVSVDQLRYVGSKLYYRIAGQKSQFIKANNVSSISRKLQPVNSKAKNLAVAVLSHNAYIYNGNGANTQKLIKKNSKVVVNRLKYIGTKLYYQIKDNNYPGDNQWIKKNNIGVVTGDKIKISNSKSVVDTKTTVVILANDANVYSRKGNKKENNTLAKGTSIRVSSLKYIWLPKKNKAELFYKMVNNKNGYLRYNDISEVEGARLFPVNTKQDARDDVTIATVADKQALQIAINHANDVKNGDAYRLSVKKQRDAFDVAVTAVANANVVANTTLSDIKQTIEALSKAEKALNGKRIVVTNVNNLTTNEANQIINLVSKVNGVDTSAIKFVNNNNNLVITTANGFAKNLNVADYIVNK